MKIYTKGGDQGQTGLFGGARVSKDDARIGVYGSIDELNAVIGTAVAAGAAVPLAARLTRVQSELFQLGAELATPPGKDAGIQLIGDDDTTRLEKEIDKMEGELEPLKNFILPGGSVVAAHLHVARTVCRRAERELVAFHRKQPVRGEVIRYVNRLSDYLFVSARDANRIVGIDDVPWNPKS